MFVKTLKELGKALKDNVLIIECEIDSETGRIVVKIKAVGSVAWGLCAVGLTAAIASAIAAVAAPPSAIIGVPMAAVGLTTASATLGASVALGAVAIGAAGGGIGALNKLRKYKMEKRDGKIILRKK